jgi:hypothetical protein
LGPTNKIPPINILVQLATTTVAQRHFDDLLKYY